MKKTYIIPNTKSVDIELENLLADSFVGDGNQGGITGYNLEDAEGTSGDVEEVRGYTNSDLWEGEW